MAKNKRTRKNRFKTPPKEKKQVVRQWSWIALKVLSGIAMIITLSLVFVFGHDWLTQCDYFRAKTVSVTGMDRLTDQSIKDAVKIREGVNILSINLVAARKRLLSEPWIAEADIRRDFPSAIAINIRENEPLAIIDLGKPFLINSRGEIFMETNPERFPTLPVITGADYQDWKSESGHVSPVFESVMTVLGIAKQENSVLPVDRIEQIRVDREIGLTLKTDSPVHEIKLGYGDYEMKFRKLAKIFSYLDLKTASPTFEKMDLRNPERIVARPIHDEDIQTIREKEA